jgi:molybdate transport system ATP-binding protein
MLEADLNRKLRDFTLEVSIRAGPGEIVALMGENGAGKSSILNLIAGLMTPDSGTVRLGASALFDPANGTDVPVEDRRIGYVSQNAAVFPHLTVASNIAFGLRAWHAPHKAIEEKVNDWLLKMDIAGLAGIKAGELSGGQKQRVALARAFAIGPRLLLLDEPLTALDSAAVEAVIPLIRECVETAGIPCIIVTHRMADAVRSADTVCLIERGLKVWEGVPGRMPACSCREGPPD